MDQNTDPRPPVEGLGEKTRRFSPWIMAAIAAVVIAVPLANGSLRPALGLPAIAILSRQRRGISAAGRPAILSPSVSKILPIPQDDHFITDVIAALPDPTILLRKDGRVVTLNAMAQHHRPVVCGRANWRCWHCAFRRVVDAVRRAGVSRRPERAEFPPSAFRPSGGSKSSSRRCRIVTGMRGVRRSACC